MSETMTRCKQCDKLLFAYQKNVKAHGLEFCSVNCRDRHLEPDSGSSFKSAPVQQLDNVRCGKCGTWNDFNHSKTCLECGDYLYQYKISAKQAPSPFENARSSLVARIAGCIGAVLLILGAFSPLISLPFGASVTYVNNGQGDGMIVLALAVLSLILSLTSAIHMLMLTSLVAGSVVAFTFYNFQVRMAEATAQIRADLIGNPFAGLAEASVKSVQLQWGWGLLIVGVIALFGAGFLGRNLTNKP